LLDTEDDMPSTRAPKLETAAARARLTIRKKPYWITIAPTISVGYRRCAGPGTWSVRAYSDGAAWTKRIGLADDRESADGATVLTFWQAQDHARTLARGQSDQDGDRPVTVVEAIERYEIDLRARGGDTYNAARARAHLTTTLESKPVALLTARELQRWRSGLTAKGLTPASVNRTRTCLRAALELAAAHDPRIVNRQAWRVGLASLPDATEHRNVILTDAEVRRLVEAAYEHDRAFGLGIEMLAVTGARLSQVARLTVSDLQADRSEPRLLMPRSAKGRMRKRIERTSIPIPNPLATVLAQSARGRPGSAPLLADTTAWGNAGRARYRRTFRAAAAAAGFDPDTVTAYALRHSSIVRQLVAGVPVRVVAALHDTSVKMIEATYSRHIAEHTDALARRAMLDLAMPAAANVTPLRGRPVKRSI
jgi:integrase